MLEVADVIFVVYTVLHEEQKRYVFFELPEAEEFIEDNDTDDYEIVEYSRAE